MIEALMLAPDMLDWLPFLIGIQIGPKLRIGGSVGKVAGNVQKAAKKAVIDTGHTVGKVADNKYVQMGTAAALAATGVGAPAAAAILAAQAGGGKLLKRGGNIGQAAKAAAGAAIKGGGGAILGKALQAAPGVSRVGDMVSKIPGMNTVRNLPGAGMIGDAAKGRAQQMMSGITGAPTVNATAGDDGPAVTGVDQYGNKTYDTSRATIETMAPEEEEVAAPGGGAGGLWNNVKSETGRVARRVLSGQNPIAGGGPGGGTGFMDKLLLGARVAAGAADSLDSRRRMGQAEKYSTGAYDAKAGMRSRALAMLADESRPDYGGLTDDPGNPYSRQRKLLAAGGA